MYLHKLFLNLINTIQFANSLFKLHTKWCNEFAQYHTLEQMWTTWGLNDSTLTGYIICSYLYKQDLEQIPQIAYNGKQLLKYNIHCIICMYKMAEYSVKCKINFFLTFGHFHICILCTCNWEYLCVVIKCLHSNVHNLAVF